VFRQDGRNERCRTRAGSTISSCCRLDVAVVQVVDVEHVHGAACFVILLSPVSWYRRIANGAQTTDSDLIFVISTVVYVDVLAALLRRRVLSDVTLLIIQDGCRPCNGPLDRHGPFFVPVVVVVIVAFQFMGM